MNDDVLHTASVIFFMSWILATSFSALLFLGKLIGATNANGEVFSWFLVFVPYIIWAFVLFSTIIGYCVVFLIFEFVGIIIRNNKEI